MKLLGIILNLHAPEIPPEVMQGMAAALEPFPGSRYAVVASAPPKALGERCDFIQAEPERGAAAAYNLAFARDLASADPAEYYYLLDPNIVPQADAVHELVEFMDNHRYAGIASGQVAGVDGEPEPSAFLYPNLHSEFLAPADGHASCQRLTQPSGALPMPDHTALVDWTPIASTLIRRAMLAKVGLFDEACSATFEATDLCRRAAIASYPTYYVSASKAARRGAQEHGLQNGHAAQAWFAAREHYLRKYHGDRYLRSANLAWIAGRAVGVVRKTLGREFDLGRARITRDFIKYSFDPRSRRPR